MTLSLLTRDHDTGALGAIAATGSLCVGGWVLRGDVRAGLSASQGTSPSTLWGEDALDLMQDGCRAAESVARLTSADPGRGHRQLSALDLAGGADAFTGTDSVSWAGSQVRPGLVVAGNMLRGPEVIAAACDGFDAAGGPMPERLLAAVRAADAAGGDFRGLKSAALLVLHPDAAPLDLRVDLDAAPLDALEKLYLAATSDPYAGWVTQVPTRRDPFRSVSDG